jgi:hypothetical protein
LSPKSILEKVGRPAGDGARIAELKARLLSTTGDKVINKIVNIAMDDSHQGQMAALKMCIDRMLPLSLFEKDAKRGSNAITINITGVGDTTIVPETSTWNPTKMKLDLGCGPNCREGFIGVDVMRFPRCGILPEPG